MDYNNTNVPADQLNENHGIAATGLNEPGAAPVANTAGHAPGHQGRDTALAATGAGIAGHAFKDHGHEGHHYGRDAAAATALGGHEMHKHENKHAGDLNKPSMGDRIAGETEKVVGKVTGNQAKVMQGEERAHGNPTL